MKTRITDLEAQLEEALERNEELEKENKQYKT